MGKKEEYDDDKILPSYNCSKYHKCFIGHAYNASWRAVIVEVCDEVLPTVGLRPWYADAHFDPTTSLRDKVVEMIAHTRYGIYDLSYWRANEQDSWQMPRNVLIELGMAIALNRPTLLLRHAENRIAGLKLPDCLQSVEPSFCEFMGGKKSLKDALMTHLPHWIKRSPEQEWRNRYCLFGGMVCGYRDTHPLSPHTIQNTIACHITDGQDTDRDDFRASVEEIIERFDRVGYYYLNANSLPHGYNFSLCSQCQLVRSTQFAIYRLTTHTPAEAFITIGMSIALEEHFRYKIPKILLTDNLSHVPSLLTGYEVVIARNDQEMRTRLAQFLPQVIQRVQETAWRPQILPFEVHLPLKDNGPSEQNEEAKEKEHLPEIHKQRKKEATKLFYSYAREDRALRDKLDMHLTHLKREGLITSWHDGDTMPGAIVKQEIEAHLNSADIILLLISPNFMVSEYCYERDMMHALKRHKAGEAIVIPILLRPTLWQDAPFSSLQMLPENKLPITAWENSDAAFANIAMCIRQAIDRFNNEH